MPIYTYQTIPKKKGQKPRVFEIQQKMTDEALKKDPKTGLPVKRIITGGSGAIFGGLSVMAMNRVKKR
jgi:predicted nucleic acid-binding Zn ribbon protein